jgi:hypothetical protein
VLKGEKEKREKESVALLAQFITSSGANGKSNCFAHLPSFAHMFGSPWQKKELKVQN